MGQLASLPDVETVVVAWPREDLKSRYKSPPAAPYRLPSFLTSPLLSLSPSLLNVQPSGPREAQERACGILQGLIKDFSVSGGICGQHGTLSYS